ncbi:MAG: IclR family transcriptional regulator [Ilumatobacteraceae bacterium]
MSVRSVERAFAILRALATGPAGVTEIAERTDLPKSTVSRILTTLVDVGVVDQSDSMGWYSLGETLLELSAAAGPGRGLVGVVRPYLAELMTEIGEATGLGVLEGRRVRYLDQVDAAHEVQVRDWTGESVDAHVVSSGLVLLAFADDDVRRTFLEGELAGWTEHSITDAAVLEQRLTDVGRAGFGWVYEEMSEGLNSVAAPIFNHAGLVVAAVHAHGPSYRFPAEGAAAATASAVVATAKRISDRLAGRHDVDEVLDAGIPSGGDTPHGGC